MFNIREVNSDMPIYVLNRTNAGKNQMPRAGFEPTTPRSHDRCSNHWATEATTVEWVKCWLQRKHRLPDICSQTSRTGNYFCRSSRHAHRTRCYRPYKCVTRHISNKLFTSLMIASLEAWNSKEQLNVFIYARWIANLKDNSNRNSTHKCSRLKNVLWKLLHCFTIL